MPDDLTALEARVVELEIRYTHQASTMETLSEVLREQYALIERQQRALDALRDRLDTEGEAPSILG